MAITEKRKAFARGLRSGMHPTDAAIAAGFKATKHIGSQASKLSKNPDVLAYMDLLDEREYRATESETAPEESRVERFTCPMKRLEAAMNSVDEKVAVTAATALMPYRFRKMAPTGMKDDREDQAAQSAKGSTFGTMDSQLEISNLDRTH